MSSITKPLMLDETGKAIVEALTQQNMTQQRINEINTAADTVKQEIENKKTDSVSAVESKATECVNAITQKGDETLKSIPEDYTNLSSDVGSLKDDLVDVGSLLNRNRTKYKNIQFEYGNASYTEVSDSRARFPIDKLIPIPTGVTNVSAFVFCKLINNTYNFHNAVLQFYDAEKNNLKSLDAGWTRVTTAGVTLNKEITSDAKYVGLYIGRDNIMTQEQLESIMLSDGFGLFFDGDETTNYFKEIELPTMPDVSELKTDVSELKTDVSELKNLNNPIPFKVICHRGYTTVADENAPTENTFSAFEMAYQKGFRYVETDVRDTSDGVVVLMHDTTINRTCTLDGNLIETSVNVSQSTFTDLQQYRANRLNLNYDDAIPTLEELVVWAKKRNVHLYLELKDGITDSGIANAVNICRKYGYMKNVTWVAFTWALFSKVTDITVKDVRLGLIRTGMDVGEGTINNALIYKNKGCDAFVLFGVSTNGSSDNDSALTDNGIALMIENDIPLEVYMLDNQALIDKYWGSYCTGFETNGYIPNFD